MTKKQKHLIWGAAAALTFLFSASALAHPRPAKKKKVVETKADVCPFMDKPKSLIRIYLFRTAKRNPLIFPI